MPVLDSYAIARTSLVAGAFYVVGPGGDDDPKRALSQVVFTNTGSVALRLGNSLTDILAGRYAQVAAATSVALEGPLDNLITYNPEAATAGAFTITAMCGARNSGQDAGVLCARGTPGSETRYQVIRPTRTAGSTVATVVPVKYQRTITTIKAYSVVKATGATLTVDLLDSQSRSVLDAVLDQEVLTDKTIYTTRTITAAIALVNRDMTLSCVSSAGGDTLNDLLIEIAHTVS